jgi:hypothetical protein
MSKVRIKGDVSRFNVVSDTMVELTIETDTHIIPAVILGYSVEVIKHVVKVGDQIEVSGHVAAGLDTGGRKVFVVTVIHRRFKAGEIINTYA